jgi:ATP-dependent Zn protease
LAAPRAGQKTFEAMDEAINKLLGDCYAEAKRIISEKGESMERVTQALRQRETLTREEFLALA